MAMKKVLEVVVSLAVESGKLICLSKAFTEAEIEDLDDGSFCIVPATMTLVLLADAKDTCSGVA